MLPLQVVHPLHHDPRLLQVFGVPGKGSGTGMQSRWLQALARPAGAEGAPECDTPFLNKQLCVSLTYQSTKGELGCPQSF